MLPVNIKALLDEVVLHRTREHTHKRNEKAREFTLLMIWRGLNESSAFINGKTDIYCEAFDKYATDIWSEIQRVLNSIGFEYYPDCEDDLIKFLKESLEVCGELDRRSLFDNKDSGLTGVQAYNSGKFQVRREHTADKLATEIKIFTSKLQKTRKPREIIEAIGPTVPFNYKLPKERKPWSFEKWCLVIATIAAVFTVIWAIFIWYKPTPKNNQPVNSRYDISLAKDYDNRFENMTKKRAQAAIAIQEYLTKGKWSLVTNNTDGLDEVLGFFDLMGYDEEKGLLNPDTLHEYFCDDIMAYYQASQGYVTNLQKSEGATTFEHIKPLFELMVTTEAKKEHTNTAAVITWSKSDLLDYFRSETNAVNLKDAK